LFYRLNVFPIEIPPLRKRREDIRLLVEFFVRRFSHQMQKRIESVSAGAMEMLTTSEWPGNIRELENFIERCVILTRGDELEVPRKDVKDPTIRVFVPAPSSFQEAERQVILDALKSSSGRVAGKGGAAERLGLKRTTLQNKMRKLNIARDDF
jgi:formate hydrogenlyase transcriptional activator